MWAAFSVDRSIPHWALAAAALVVLVSASWLVVQNQRLRVGLQQALAGQAELRREEGTFRQHIAELEEKSREQVHDNQHGSEVAQLEAPMGPVMTLRLTPGLARATGEPQKALILPSASPRLRLELMLDQNEYKKYETVLLTAEGREVLRGKAIRSQSINGNILVHWSLPARMIPSGDYVVQLKGQLASGSLEEVESYSFRVLRK
jgi:hypothetical protein